jgi:hypothetical protein
MALPPMGKESRKQVHELAIVFNLKSQSKGKGDGRYTTLTKTTRSGIEINEQKVRRVVKNNKGFTPPGGSKGRNAVIMPRHKDGDEVGKVRDVLVLSKNRSHGSLNSGGAKDRRSQYWLQDARFHGMV